MQLMLLSEGYILYYGHTLAAAHWLAIAGHPLPFGVSVPDHILDLANGDIPGVDPEHSQAAKKDLIDKFMHRKIGKSRIVVWLTRCQAVACLSTEWGTEMRMVRCAPGLAKFVA